MQAYKFVTKVLENGIIKIPEIVNYVNQEIEIFIVLKSKFHKREKKISADEFLNKWTGFLSDINTDDIKYQYLTEKYK